MTRTVRLVGDTQRAYAHKLIDAAPANYVMKLAEETRNDRQNAKLHAMIDDLREQVPEHARFTVEQTKLRLLDALGEEMQYLPKLDGAGFFPVGQKTRDLTVSQFSALIEILYALGAEHGVRWSDPKEAAA